MKLLLVLLVAVVIATPIAWLAGEQHRENCIREGKQDCSVLPWEDGKPKPKPPSWLDAPPE